MGVLTKLNLMTRPRQTTGSVYATGQLLRPHQITTHFHFLAFIFIFLRLFHLILEPHFLRERK